ncbi:MAG: hypothetical protein RJB59_810 [Actinomycetota bacterium]
MPSINATDSSAISDVLVIGFARDKKSKKFSLETGDLTFDAAPVIEALDDLGATAAADEVIKLPGSATKLVVLTGLGQTQKNYAHETLRRAAGAAARALSGHNSATFALPDLMNFAVLQKSIANQR